MILQHNIPALNALRSNKVNAGLANKNLEKLSSGYKINRAGDDAAGLAISEKMRRDINGLEKAVDNTANTVDLVQTAEGGLQEMHEVLQRMSEIAVQASNGTYQNEVDREALDLEMQELKMEFDRIASYTNYNDIKLLDGTLGAVTASYLTGGGAYPAGSIEAVANYFESLGFPMDLDSNPQVWSTIEFSAYSDELMGGNINMVFQAEDLTGEDQTRISIQVGGKTYTATYVGATNGTPYTSVTGDVVPTSTYGSYLFFDEEGKVMAQLSCTLYGTHGDMPAPSGGLSGLINGVRLETEVGVRPIITQLLEQFQEVDNSHPLYNASMATEHTNVQFQVGSRGTADQQISLNLPNVSSISLGFLMATEYNKTGTVAGVNVLTREAADDSIEVLETAINQVSTVRATLGALQNRMDHTMNNLKVTSENLQDSESTLRDADMAMEMMEFTRNSIVAQASQAMLAQANQLPQGVLALLQ